MYRIKSNLIRHTAGQAHNKSTFRPRVISTIVLILILVSLMSLFPNCILIDDNTSVPIQEIEEQGVENQPIRTQDQARTTRASTPIKLSGLPDEGKYNYVTLVDVNKDEYLDIIVGAGGYPGNEPGGLYVNLNQAGKSFTDASTGLPGEGKNYFGSVQVIDIDKDSNLDLIAAYESRWSKGDDKGIGLWLGNGGSGGSMSWTAANSPVSSGSFDSVCCADINNDGNVDLVGASSSGIHAWQGSSGSTLAWTEVSSGLPSSNEYTGVTLGDINNDDRLDIVAGSYSSKGISVYLCSSSGSVSWTEGHTDTDLVKSGNSFGMYLTDLNEDSNLGIRGGLKAYIGNGNSGTKDTWWVDVSSGLPTSGDYYQIAVEDINNDGKLDIGSNFKIWSNTGSMTNPNSYSWEQLDLGISDSKSVGLAIGDLDNDEQLDIVGCGWETGVKAYILGSGSGGPTQYHLIKGIVKDQQNDTPLAGVTVELEPGGYSTTTDANGKYTLSIPNGSYIQSFKMSGYQSDSINIEINGNNIIKDFALSSGTPINDEEEKDDNDGGLPFMEAPIIAMALLIVIILLGRSYNRKK